MYIQTFNSVTYDLVGQPSPSPSPSSSSSPLPLINSVLLADTAKYNNTLAFKHLCAYPNMFMSVQSMHLLSDICRHGNVDMLQLYLNITGHHTLGEDRVHLLMAAIESGNEHFVRLLLHHLSLDQLIAEHLMNIHTNPRRAVNVRVLKVLHEEFNCLLRLGNLSDVLLQSSVQFGAKESAIYIMNHLHIPDSMWLVEDCFILCTASGNIDIFMALSRWPPGKEFLNSESGLVRIISDARDRDHVDFLLQLRDRVDTMALAPNQDTLDELNAILSQYSLPWGTPSNLLKAILDDDLGAAEALIDKIDELDEDTCESMSTAMAMSLFRPRSISGRLVLRGNTLNNMIKAIGRRGSSITGDIVCMMIDNCDLPSPSHTKDSLVKSASISLALMERIHNKFNVDYNGRCLAQALIRRRCNETLPTLLQQVVNDSDRDAIMMEANASLRSVTIEEFNMFASLLPSIASNPETCLWASKCDTVDVFAHLINKFTYQEMSNNRLLVRIVEEAYHLDKPEVIRCLELQYVGHDLPRPTHSMLEEAVTANCLDILEYYFDISSSFKSMSISHRLRTLHTVRYLGYIWGTTRVIKLCNERINMVKSDTPTLEHKPDVTTNITSSSIMDVPFHQVFGDGILGPLIMRNVGEIYRSLGYGEDQLIKGSTLLSNHSLLQYIKYGATEWFLKSYSLVSDKFVDTQNDNLMSAAFERCDKRILDILLDNPNMTINSQPPWLPKDFVRSVSTCTHPDWEWILSEYLMIKCLASTNLSSFVIDGDIVSHIIHPLFIERLINIGITLTQIPYNPSYIKAVEQGWLSKPWACEMFSLLLQWDLMEDRFMDALQPLVVAHDQLEIFKLYLELETPYFDPDAIIRECCQHGRVEMLNLLLSRLKGDSEYSMIMKRIDWIACLRLATECGSRPLVAKLHDKLVEQQDNSLYALSATKLALDKDHFEMADYLLDILMSDQRYHGLTIMINKVTGSLSKHDEMMDRLKAHPNITLVLTDLKSQTSTLSKALADGDVDVARQIIAANPGSKLDIGRLCRLMEFVGLPGPCKVTEADVFEFSKLITISPHDIFNNTIFQVAAQKSLSLLKLVVSLCTQPPTSSPSPITMLDSSDIKKAIESCVKRGDTDSIEYLVDQARSHHLPSDIIPLEISNTTVLAYIMARGYRFVVSDTKSNALGRLVEWACLEGHVDVVRLVLGRCTTDEQQRRHMPSLSCIIQATERNQHQLIKQLLLLDSDAVDQWMHLPIILNTIRFYSTKYGALKIMSTVQL
ncbi:hypothetical protein SAMD00019534_096060 [Acytostelium subglobosum LB1]|uniref:hypothetical protein n=1 Tax=Acytostelium subglobosum LB1 TaxID=1410327 RepID=UPI0006448282|nr:hypothetical protein SAMD00019534_096060 [Acytostelium subglobosum LB1]GAM26431.1 hypothetical protein SAMD00019534_096060 [Acytostelium subglobosum LB1]|eukprot:XP_012750527.1 hypothetical protein SAMD00019534_096060 [Acytostelium subglobosum LB1]